MQTASKIEENMPSWDLTDFYSSIGASEVEADFKELENKTQEFVKTYKGKIAGLGGDELYKAVKSYEEISDYIGKLNSYAFLQYCTDMQNQDAAIFYQNTEERLNNIITSLLFFTLEINKLDEKQLQSWIKNSELKYYESWLRDTRVLKDYQLSDKEEEILHEKSLTGNQAWVRLFDETMAGLKFDFKGEDLNFTQVSEKLSSHDESERRAAAESISAVLKDNIQMLSLITNTLIKDKEIEDNKRGFKAPISSRNLANLVEDEVVDALIDTVKSNYPKLAHRYFKIKAKWLGKDKLNFWDRNAPLEEGGSKFYSWDESVEIVQNAYEEFSPELANVGKQFFDNNWIDVPVKQGKRFGAFSHPTVPSVHPYILLNHQGKIRDVMTLAHELGHGVHQVLAAEQGALMARTPLTLAETASVFGEQLTFRALLSQEKDEKKREIMIANKVEDMLNTVVRQIAFCDFERKIHGERKGGELSSDRIGEIWLETQRESLGDALILDGDYHMYWSYIPHFIHSPFYVYSYAFGDCLVNSLYAVYQKGEVKDFESKYLDMLKAGGTLRHKELLKPFGLDASKPDFWQQGLDVISEFIDELE